MHAFPGIIRTKSCCFVYPKIQIDVDCAHPHEAPWLSASTAMWPHASPSFPEELMTSDRPKPAGLKQKAVHEFEELAWISLYLAFFFCSIATYKMLLLNEFHLSYFNYGTALINALVIAKVILIGEYARLGKRNESKPLLLSAVNKAILFSVLVFAFHIVEEVIKRLVHGEKVAGAFRNARLDDLLGRTLILLCTFIPFFAFRELSRVLGENKFRELFLQPRAAKKSDLSGTSEAPVVGKQSQFR